MISSQVKGSSSSSDFNVWGRNNFGGICLYSTISDVNFWHHYGWQCCCRLGNGNIPRDFASLFVCICHFSTAAVISASHSGVASSWPLIETIRRNWSMSTLSLFFILVLTRFRALHPYSGHVFETGIDGHTSAMSVRAWNTLLYAVFKDINRFRHHLGDPDHTSYCTLG